VGVGEGGLGVVGVLLCKGVTLAFVVVLAFSFWVGDWRISLGLALHLSL
jgi:hypothetical protein